MSLAMGGTEAGSKPGESFEEATAVEAAGEGRHAADLHSKWSVLGKPNGGYLLATIARAAVTRTSHQEVLGASAHYVSSPDPGPVDIETEVLREGRSVSQVSARLTQGGAVRVQALFTLGDLAPASTPDWSAHLPTWDGPPRQDCVRMRPRPPEFAVDLLDVADLRLDPACAGFVSGRPSGSGELRGYVSFLDGATFDSIGLLFAGDCFPPATLEVAVTGWVPTVQLSTYVRALPAPGPLRLLHRAHLIEGGMVDESCTLWDSAGALVAQTRQLAAIRLP